MGKSFKISVTYSLLRTIYCHSFSFLFSGLLIFHSVFGKKNAFIFDLYYKPKNNLQHLTNSLIFLQLLTVRWMSLSIILSSVQKFYKDAQKISSSLNLWIMILRNKGLNSKFARDNKHDFIMTTTTTTNHTQKNQICNFINELLRLMYILLVIRLW